MKTKPTIDDISAVQYFTLDPGVMFWSTGYGWCRSLGSGDSYSAASRTYPDPHPSSWAIRAIDLDDPATQGCLLAQITRIADGDKEPIAILWHNGLVQILRDGAILAEAKTYGSALLKTMVLFHKMKYRRG